MHVREPLQNSLNVRRSLRFIDKKELISKSMKLLALSDQNGPIWSEIRKTTGSELL